MLNIRHNKAQRTDQVLSASPSTKIVNAVTIDEGNQVPQIQNLDTIKSKVELRLQNLEPQSRHATDEPHHHEQVPSAPLQQQFQHNSYDQTHAPGQSEFLFNSNSRPTFYDQNIRPDFAAQHNVPYVYRSGIKNRYKIRDKQYVIKFTCY